MSTEIVTVRANDLRALLLFAAKKDVRSYLNGVCFETEKGSMVATNGSALLMVKAEHEPSAKAVARFIVSRDDLERAIKLTSKKNPYIAVSLSHVQPSNNVLRTIELTTTSGQILAREVDGRFPDWERCIPTKTSGEFAKFDPDVIASMRDAFGLVTDNHRTLPHLFLNGNAGAIVACHDSRALGLVMPYRCEMDKTTLDQWRDNALINFGLIRPVQQEEQQAA